MTDVRCSNIKTKKMICLLTALTVLITAFIFFNSFQDSEASNASSKKIEAVVEPVVEEMLGEDHDVNVYKVVRKTAHVIEFTMLGMASFALMKVLRKAYKKPLFGYCLFYVLAVAVTDEYIQSFTDRTSLVEDILLDFAGALIGIFLMFAIRMRKKTRKDGEAYNSYV